MHKPPQHLVANPSTSVYAAAVRKLFDASREKKRFQNVALIGRSKTQIRRNALIDAGISAKDANEKYPALNQEALQSKMQEAELEIASIVRFLKARDLAFTPACLKPYLSHDELVQVEAAKV